MENYFEELYNIDVGSKIEKKNNLSYLSWSYAWAEVKKKHPDSTYTIYENAEGWNYHTDGRTCWVKTGVTVNGIEHVETLAVMNNRNASIPLEAVTSYDINKSIQRCLTKGCARHGLGLYVYAGEDLPECLQETEEIPGEGIPQAAAEKTPKLSEEEIRQKKELSAVRSAQLLKLVDEKNIDRKYAKDLSQQYGFTLIADATPAIWDKYIAELSKWNGSMQ